MEEYQNDYKCLLSTVSYITTSTPDNVNDGIIAAVVILIFDVEDDNGNGTTKSHNDDLDEISSEVSECIDATDEVVTCSTSIPVDDIHI